MKLYSKEWVNLKVAELRLYKNLKNIFFKD